MLVLALDTATRAGSCAVARDGHVLLETRGDGARSHGERLPMELMTLLEAAGIVLRDVDVFAVTTGPGSFTGLRIGIATMQGLAFAEGRPLIGVSGLDALDRVAASPRVATWVDAWRGEVYAALYEHGVEAEAPLVARPADLLARLAGRPTWFIGDGSATYRDLILGALGGDAHLADPAEPPLAGTVARMATVSARSGHLPPPHAIRPLYVRRTDAELARDAAGRASRTDPHPTAPPPHGRPQ